MTAAGQQLGEEGERAALCVASSGRSMELPGVGREHQAGLDELARGFAQAREEMALSWDWRRRIKREAQEAEKWQARQGGAPGARTAARAGAGSRAAMAKPWAGAGQIVSA